jgi:predicted DNA-binding transcriptional regulator AlpA
MKYETKTLEAQPAWEDGQLIRADRLWQILAISSATGWRWHAAGRLLRPISFGTTLRWRLTEVHDWIAAGCPPRDEWEAVRGARRRR